MYTQFLYTAGSVYVEMYIRTLKLLSVCTVLYSVHWTTHCMYMYIHVCTYNGVCCTALMRPSQANTVQSIVAPSLVSHDYSDSAQCTVYIYMYI